MPSFIAIWSGLPLWANRVHSVAAVRAACTHHKSWRACVFRWTFAANSLIGDLMQENHTRLIASNQTLLSAKVLAL